MRRIGISGFGLLLFLLVGCSAQDDRSRPFDQRWIAHALGAYEGKTYLNCLECFQHNYRKGHRLFEMDFLMSSEGHMVGMHDGQEAGFGLAKEFSTAQFRSSSLEGTTPLTDKDVADLAHAHADWYLITDIKSDNRPGLERLCKVFAARDLSCRARVVPQVYSGADMEIIAELGFERVIFSLYRVGNRPSEVLAVLDQYPQIWAVTMPHGWWNEAYAEELQRRGIRGFVHTVNDAERAAALFSAGVSGIYTDSLGIGEVGQGK